MDKDNMILQNFIGGQYRALKSKATIQAFNPSTGLALYRLPDSSAADVDEAVESAARAFEQWSATPVQERARILNRIADILERRADEFAEAESRDQGKTVKLARTAEIPRAIANFRFFAAKILQSEEGSSYMDVAKALNYTQRSPIGVAALISPWNLPLYLLTWKLAPAIAVGNTAVCKPSELTSLTASMLGAVLQEAGLPPGVCNIIFGSGAVTGAALTAHPKVELISFTGGTKTGASIAASVATQFKKLSLELGGKNPNVIFADAELTECVATSVRAAFQNQGEICLCGSRIFVEEKIYEDFTRKFVAAAKAFKVGDPAGSDTDMGALVSEAHLKKVQSYLELATSEGGKILCGGDRPKNLDAKLAGGYFLNPTVIVGLSPTCRVQQEEIFGPVVTITPFKDESEAIALANGTRYGLSASIWTTDVKRALNVAAKLKTGTVWINTWMLRDLRVPFGGVKESGMGREGGNHSIDFFTAQKNICVKL